MYRNNILWKSSCQNHTAERDSAQYEELGKHPPLRAPFPWPLMLPAPTNSRRMFLRFRNFLPVIPKSSFLTPNRALSNGNFFFYSLSVNIAAIRSMDEMQRIWWFIHVIPNTIGNLDDIEYYDIHPTSELALYTSRASSTLPWTARQLLPNTEHFLLKLSARGPPQSAAAWCPSQPGTRGRLPRACVCSRRHSHLRLARV